jgi:sRNA-binding regulator protein Hfq
MRGNLSFQKDSTLDLEESSMGHLAGLSAYLESEYGASIFDRAKAGGGSWNLHLHGRLVVTARITENLVYDIRIEDSDRAAQVLPKIQVKFLYPADVADAVLPLLKLDPKVGQLKQGPIIYPHERNFVKNKTLFALMQEKQVIFITLLEGELLRGLIAGFSRYDLTLNLKGGRPMTILRHSIFDVRDKKGRCYLKRFQQVHQDWKKSSLYREGPYIP